MITRWDFGRDSLVEVSSDSFRITVSDAQRTVNVYVKTLPPGRRVLRMERVENPRIPVADMIYERIDQGLAGED